MSLSIVETGRVSAVATPSTCVFMASSNLASANAPSNRAEAIGTDGHTVAIAAHRPVVAIDHGYTVIQWYLRGNNIRMEMGSSSVAVRCRTRFRRTTPQGAWSGWLGIEGAGNESVDHVAHAVSGGLLFSTLYDVQIETTDTGGGVAVNPLPANVYRIRTAANAGGTGDFDGEPHME